MPDTLTEAILDALTCMAEEEELVITTSVPRQLAGRIRNRIANEVPIPPISKTELTAIRSLIYRAVNDTRFFDFEMPTLTGLTAEEFNDLAAKLPIE
ncbi:hypothetical protein IWQ54_000775 [Labrenzia sp. EL_195]|nr:hypothetical protein [Labrenzia sp. EL_195]